MDFEKLADACGDLARGFKKLKAVFKNWNENATPVSPSNSIPSQIPSTPSSTPPSTPLHSLHAKSWQDTHEEWLLSKKSRWGPTFATKFANFVIGQRWRCDNFKNVWEYIGPRTDLNPNKENIAEKRYWRIRPYTVIEELYESYVQALMCVSPDLVKQHREVDSDLWREIHRGKKARLHNVLNAKPLSRKQFIRIVKDNHKVFSPLRGTIKIV